MHCQAGFIADVRRDLSFARGTHVLSKPKSSMFRSAQREPPTQNGSEDNSFQLCRMLADPKQHRTLPFAV